MPYRQQATMKIPMQLSDRIMTVAPSLTLQITAKAKAMKARGVNIISFGAGEPDFDTPEFIKDKTIESLQNGFTKYTPAAGIPELRKAIADKFSCENNIPYTEKNVVVCCGAKHALYNVFQVLLNPGDEVLIPAPYWLSYPEMVRLAEGNPVIVETAQSGGFKVTPSLLDAARTERTRALILNSPSNPTGAVYSRAELEAIAAWAVKRAIAVISDEIYEHLLYEGAEHVSIAALDDAVRDLVITVNGVSKSYAMTGWRIGYVAAPEAVAKAIGTLQSHSTSNPTSFAQIGAVHALREGGNDVKRMIAVFRKRRELILKELAAIPGLKPYKPAGAFYVFCDCSALGMTAMTLTNHLLDEANVAVIPGEPFGSQNHIRLSFAISDAAISEGIRRIGTWIASRQR